MFRFWNVVEKQPNCARQPLFHRDALREVARLVYVAAAADGDVVGEQLQRDDLNERHQQLGRGGNWMTCSTSSPIVVSPSVAMAMTRPLRAVTSWMFESVFS